MEVPHFASDGVLEAIDDATLGGKGFRGEDYLPATWQGGTFQGKRYPLPLDVPQHMLYLNVKVMKDAGLVGADGRPRVPASRDELVAMAKQMTKGDSFGFAIGTVNPGQVHVGLPQPALAERRQHLRAPISSGSAWPSRPRSRWRTSGPRWPRQHKIVPPANASCRDAFIAGKLGMWIAGSWNFTGLRDAKVEFTVAPRAAALQAAGGVGDAAPVHASRSRRPSIAPSATRRGRTCGG